MEMLKFAGCLCSYFQKGNASKCTVDGLYIGLNTYDICW